MVDVGKIWIFAVAQSDFLFKTELKKQLVNYTMNLVYYCRMVNQLFSILAGKRIYYPR